MDAAEHRGSFCFFRSDYRNSKIVRKYSRSFLPILDRSLLQIRNLKNQVTQQTKTSVNMEDDYKELQAELGCSKDVQVKLEQELETVSKELQATKDELQKARKEVRVMVVFGHQRYFLQQSASFFFFTEQG